MPKLSRPWLRKLLCSTLVSWRLVHKVAAVFLLSCHFAASAMDDMPDKFNLAFSGYALPSFESSMSLLEPNSGIGGSISPEDTLGLNTQQTVLRLDGRYRFNANHSIIFSWHSVSSSGTKTIEEEIDWIDDNGNPIVIPIGVKVGSSLDYDVYKLGYLWTFYHSDQVELSAGTGIHMTQVAVGLEADTANSGGTERDVRTSLPLPVLSLALIYNVTPKFNWYVKTEFFALKLGDWEGSYTDGMLGVEYRLLKHLAFGTGLGTNALKISEQTSDYKFTYDNRILGVMLYASAYF